eukprot:COSAG01_NODE_41124_length_455_cov_1.598315_1_plen_65_part_01
MDSLGRALTAGEFTAYKRAIVSKLAASGDQAWFILREAPSQLRADKETVLAAVAECGAAIQFAPA